MEIIDKAFKYVMDRVESYSSKVTIGKIESSKVDGFYGVSYCTSALVPLIYSKKLFHSTEESGHDVNYTGPIAIENYRNLFTEKYFIRGLLSDSLKLEPLIITWTRHNKTVYLPEPKILIHYALINRNTETTSFWDDPSIPRYGIIKVVPTSHYDIENGHSLAFVEIEREYLEDYAYLKKCNVANFYFEERWISEKNWEIEDLLGKKDGVTLELENQRIKIVRTKYTALGIYNIQIWGRQILLEPKSAIISNPEPLVLNWPGFDNKISENDARKLSLDFVYLNDIYLKEYENKNEYTIDPETGSVNFQGWWGIGFCNRIGRNYVSVELRKLYEGLPDYIIKQINKYAVAKSVVDERIAQLGNRNIGQRAHELITIFLQIFKHLSIIFKKFEIYYDEEELCSYSLENVEYHGWFSFKELCKLGYIAEIEMTESQFYDRCSIITSFFESIKEKPLRVFIKRLGVEESLINGKRTLKLLQIIRGCIR